MRINVNNFTGILKNQNRYRILTKSQFIESNNEYMLSINVETSHPFFNTWLYDANLSSVKYYKKGEYKKALRSGLIELENKLGVQLLKAELVAVA